MKTESFGWQTRKKICNGITDFGLLREKPPLPSDQSKPNVSSIYISRAVVIVGVIATITFLICLVLADKYQKSVTLSHHYASFIHEQERGKYYRRFNVSTYGDGQHIRENNAADDDRGHHIRSDEFDEAAYIKIQNFSNKLPPVQEINLLLPLTTVLHSLNTSRNAGRSLHDNFSLQSKRMVKHFSPSDYRHGNLTTADETIVSKRNISSLADLLKRTELKSIPLRRDDASATTNVSHNATESTIHFAQLESYGIRRNAKNLQDIVKYIRCSSASNCVFGYESAIGVDTSNIPTIATAQYQTSVNHDQTEQQERHPHRIHATAPMSSSIADASENNDEDMLHSDTNAAPYYYYSPSFAVDRRNRISSLDPYHKYRAFNPQDINQLQHDEAESTPPVVNTAEQTAVHRFSNRMYHNRGPNIENIGDIVQTQTLEPFLKPPTPPPPTTLSFTPSYTTAVFRGFDHFNSHDNDLRSESTADEPITAHVKPISLMVEIFPANDYELPASLFTSDNRLQYPKQESVTRDMNQVGNPSSISSWKLPLVSQNRMRLLVNLFPHHQYNSKP